MLDFFRSLCKGLGKVSLPLAMLKVCKRLTPKEITWQFVSACRNGDCNTAKEMLELDEDSHLDLDNGMLIATSYNQENMVRLLLDSGANNLDNCLRTAVEKNYYTLTELFLQKGANPIVGIRVSKSPNITSILYKYDFSRSKNIK